MPPKEPEISIESLLEHHGVEPKTLHRRATRMTRRKILMAAMECFAKDGYHKTTIREISARAGVTLGALYHHFKGKKDLLMQMNRSRQINQLEITRKALAEEKDFFDGLRVALQGQFQLLAEDPILRGVYREYMGMAMVDPDINAMHTQNDMEFHDVFLNELERRYPKLPEKARASLTRMLLVSFQGLVTYMLVLSPIGRHYQEILDALLDSYRFALKSQKRGKYPD